MTAAHLTASFASFLGAVVLTCVAGAANAQSVPPVPLTTLLITPLDYPEVSVRLQEQGSVGISFTVNEGGTVENCIVTVSSGKARLDDAACKATSRWVYKPATMDGKPVAAFMSTTLFFSLREANTVPPVPLSSQTITALEYPVTSVRLQEQGNVGIAYTVNVNGAVEDCIVRVPSGKPRLDEAACAAASRWLYQPATADGMPVPVSMSATVAFRLVEAPGNAGVDAARRGDFNSAIAIWTPLAEQGDVLSQRNLGLLYAGVKQNPVEAAKWFGLAAAQNDTVSQLTLGEMYAEGSGVRRNYPEAVKWYELAAAQSDGEAQFKLGVLYDEGRVGRRDYAQAVKWYRLAAKQHVREAMVNLAQLYLDGRGVSKDLLYAYMWHDVSNSFLLRNPEADARKSIEFTRRAERSMSRDQMIRAMAMSAHCLKSDFDDCEDSATMASAVNPETLAAAAHQRDELDAAAQLGAAVGYSQSPNRRIAARAVPILRPLAERGDGWPQTILAGMYERGHGVEQDLAEAGKWYRAAAGQGFADAQIALAQMYETGRGMPENPLKALMWFTIAGSDAANTGFRARAHSNRLRRVMVQFQIDQADAMVARCQQSQLKDCD